MTDDLLAAALAALAAQPDTEYTTRSELQERMGATKDRALEALRRLAAAGVLETRKVRRINLAGDACMVAGYRVKRETPP